MIIIKTSLTADTRTCDFSKVSKEQLILSSQQHIGDVAKGMFHFVGMMISAANSHDCDKINDIDEFHRDFLTGFERTKWWDKHRKYNRHHLIQADGVPDDVNLIDVLEMIVDCVMAGMARSGSVYPLDIPPEVLMKAFHNTAESLKVQIVVEKQVSQQTDEATTGAAIRELAAELNGIEYPCCIPQHLKNAAKEQNLVIVYGASDDLMKLEGAIDDEIGACNGTKVMVDAFGVLPDWGEGIEDEATAEDYFKRKPGAREIKEIWGRDGYSWMYETDIPHATFEILEDGEKYCRGIVFALADLGSNT